MPQSPGTPFGKYFVEQYREFFLRLMAASESVMPFARCRTEISQARLVTAWPRVEAGVDRVLEELVALNSDYLLDCFSSC